MRINSFAFGLFKIESATFTKGWSAVKPPTVPTAIGISIQNLKTPLSIFT
jgi:hypothetical protein